MKLKESQKYYYNLQVGKKLPPNGPGSVDKHIKEEGTIDFINDILKKYNITSISDSPSGVYQNWIYLLDLPNRNIDYIGYDINDLIIQRNKEENPNVKFIEFDMCEEILPKTDLIICRDCLFHLPNDFVSRTLKNFKDSKSTYLLATEQRWVKKNNELTPKELKMECGWKPINLEIEPFDLGEPLEIHNEDRWKRSMSIWKIN